MNLSSRCRTAFEQIDKLTKELDMYKEKAAEMAIRQRRNE